MHMPLLNPVLRGGLGGNLFEGSVNLYADSPIAFPVFPAPAIREIAGEKRSFVPIVLDEKEVGVAARKVAPGSNALLWKYLPAMSWCLA